MEDRFTLSELKIPQEASKVNIQFAVSELTEWESHLIKNDVGRNLEIRFSRIFAHVDSSKFANLKFGNVIR